LNLFTLTVGVFAGLIGTWAAMTMQRGITVLTAALLLIAGLPAVFGWVGWLYILCAVAAMLAGLLMPGRTGMGDETRGL
jgi:ribose/xylose/arabinose/galactoside ABC-type transport system permease subunit